MIKEVASEKKLWKRHKFVVDRIKKTAKTMIKCFDGTKDTYYKEQLRGFVDFELMSFTEENIARWEMLCYELYLYFK